ncbi:MAG: aromatic amino acid ammonia-lyase, partial [Myxococcota bacterium]
MNYHPITIGEEPLTVDDMVAIAVDGAEVKVSPTALAQSAQGFREVEKRLAAGVPTYGVNTGFGHASTRTVSPESAMTLAQGLLRYHGCGTGDVFTEETAAAIVAARLVSLARGYSAVRPAVLQSLGALLNHRLLPCVPVEGSVGASGDLTPLSYVAAALQGERHVFLNGRPTASADALTQTGLTALTLLPKESLAIMNGTSVMGGLLVLAWSRARRLSRLASATTAMACEVMAGVPDHFDPMVFQLKPHAGTVRAAGWIRLGLQGTGHTPARLQDRYCLRCAPHVIGVLEDTLQYTRSWIETEINGVNDNPIVDPESGAVFHGGNFYGGHLCAAADALKAAMASTAELLERQLIALCDEASNGDLPASLLPGDPSTAHGFKAMQISASALVAEALKLSVPASIFSRSTENHNQDKVSMGTIAARDALRIAELCERVLAIALIALAQGAELSDRCGGHAA